MFVYFSYAWLILMVLEFASMYIDYRDRAEIERVGQDNSRKKLFSFRAIVSIHFIWIVIMLLGFYYTRQVSTIATQPLLNAYHYAFWIIFFARLPYVGNSLVHIRKQKIVEEKSY